MAAVSPQAFWELMDKPWMMSNSLIINGVDSYLLVNQYLLPMTKIGEETTLRIIRMPFLETIDRGDTTTLKTLRFLLQSDRGGLDQLLSLPSLREGITEDHTDGTIALMYLELKDPEAAAAIRALPWAKDQPLNIDPLMRLALESSRVFWAWMERFGDDLIYSSTLGRVTVIARLDEEAAVEIVKMPFLETSESSDFLTLDFMIDMAGADPDGIRKILSHPELSGGITDDNAFTVAKMYLDLRQPDIAAAIEALPWVKDGLNAYQQKGYSSGYRDSGEIETNVFWTLVSHARTDSQLIKALVGKPWFQDRISLRESSAIDDLISLSGATGQTSMRILEMPFLETIGPGDSATLERLVNAAWIDRLEDILSHPALRDGIRDDQGGIVALLYLMVKDSDAAAVIEAFPWIQDGISSSEDVSVQLLQESALTSPSTFRALAQKSWVYDGLTPDELSAIGYLSHMPHMSEAEVLRIVAMPFLETFEGVDAAAVGSLVSLSQNLSRGDYLRQVLSHPNFRDGITNDSAVVLSVLGTLFVNKPTLLDPLLEGLDTVMVEKRTIMLPVSGEAVLAIVRTDPGAPNAMDPLEHALRNHEEFMSVPLPRRYVAILQSEGVGGGGGPMGILSIDSEYGDPGSVIAHEAAHIYWPFYPSWIAEGAAVFLAQVSENARIGARLEYDTSCELVDNLADLEELDLRLTLESGGSDNTVYFSGCNYTLGWGLFFNLYDGLGEETFRQGFRNLYLKMRAEDSGRTDTECTGVERSVCSVKAAFVAGSDPETAAIAESIIDRWYYGSELSAQ